MADTQLSALPVVTTSAAADSIPIVQGGVTSRIHPGPGGGLDADMVSGCGIGAYPVQLPAGTDLNALKIGGNYSVTYQPDMHFPATGSVIMYTASAAAAYGWQLAQDTTTGWLWYRLQKGAGWSLWVCLTDIANGGQPPMPKSRNSPGNIGHFSWDNSGYVGGSSGATGIWEIIGLNSSNGILINCVDAEAPGGRGYSYYSVSMTSCLHRRSS